MINRLPWRKKLRTSAANNLDKINEIIDYINTSDISPVMLSDSASGRSVVAGRASSLKSLAIEGESVQDGTPTPDAPVEVQTVKGRNLAPTSRYATSSTASQFSDFTQPVTVFGVTFTRNNDGSITISGTATNNATLYFPLESEVPSGTDVYISGNPNTTLRVTVCSTDNSNIALISDTGSGAHGVINKPIDRSRLYVPSGTVISTPITVKIQVEVNMFTPYTPYGSIGLLIGDDVTPIDLQGNELASLPDGTHDRLLVDSAGHVTIDNTIGHIASYNGETVGDVWISSTGQLTTGAEVFYKLATPETIDLGYIDPPTINESDVISVSAEVVPVIDVAWWIYEDITAIIEDLKAYVDYKTAGEQEPTAGLNMSRPANISMDTQTDQPTIIEESEMI